MTAFTRGRGWGASDAVWLRAPGSAPPGARGRPRGGAPPNPRAQGLHPAQPIAGRHSPGQASQGAQASESTNIYTPPYPTRPAHIPTTGKAEQAAWVSALSLSGIPDSGMVVSSALSRTRGCRRVSPAPAVQERQFHPGSLAASTAAASDLPSLRAGGARVRPCLATEDTQYQKGWVFSLASHSLPEG